ncbi:hypothetical protein N7520_007098 [Penicillium odoratum]|uniref:uncharacterized protein n=1 Tax=Penicillium odoratum TaxID=1167516 RepID=UPI0025485764|nr:uncharacterized protein N7520_007098 [Penicillium odoratum]KAJ5759942.1 hypothetical protein N7520_007098 [Penicillium odoratum]
MASVSFSQLDEATAHSSSPSSPTSSSDKENHRRRPNKRNTAKMPSTSASKRRRLTDRTPNTQSQMSSSQRHSMKYYDPDQDPTERRQVRKGFRDLTRDFNDSRAEYMQSGNNGILLTIEKANELYTGVKQTSDATLDSRLLVNTADLSHRKAAQLTLGGDSTAGIDVDEFVSKCIAYMRRGPDTSTATPNGAARRRRHAATQRDADDSDGPDEGDAMNWDWLGRTACLPYNKRPTVSGWLLGPLSVQKRTRQMTQRTQAERFDPTQVTKPNELQQDDLGLQENTNLTQICTNIKDLLDEFQNEAQAAASEKLAAMEDPDDEDTKQKIMAEHDIADDGGVPLFRFCINPRSFGQSVENIFYVSFLVRDGAIGVSRDSRYLPTLHSSTPYEPHVAQAQGIQKHQAIFSLDFETWEQLIDVFKITESIIPHRNEPDGEAATTWYGGR